MTTRFLNPATSAIVLVPFVLTASAYAQSANVEESAEQVQSEDEPRTNIVRDLTATRGPRRRRDAGVELNDAIDGEKLAWWPWLAAFSMASVAISVDILVDSSEPRWTGVGSLDLNLTEALLLDGPGRERASLASDVLLISTVLATYLDAALWRHDERSNSRTSYRLIMMDSMMFSMNTALVALVKGIAQRQRPEGRFCESDDEFGGCENSSINRSFFSGHASTSFTAASLMCAHQQLRGQTPLGRFQCLTSLGAATSTSILRLAAGKHYLSDVLVGAVVGFLVGYIFPVYVFPRALPLIDDESASRLGDERTWW